MADLDDSILNTTKKLLGIEPEYDVFDTDIIFHINSTLNTLSQLGLHSVDGYEITSSEETWSDFLGDKKLLNLVKSYVYLKVRLLYDPPTTSFAIESFSKQIAEFEFRILVQIENDNPPDSQVVL